VPCTAHMPVPRSQIGRPTEVGGPSGLAGYMHDPAHALRDQVKAAAPGIAETHICEPAVGCGGEPSIPALCL